MNAGDTVGERVRLSAYRPVRADVRLLLGLAAPVALVQVGMMAMGAVDTIMVDNQEIRSLWRPDLEMPTREDVAEGFMDMNALPVPWIEVSDVTNAVLFLASDEARYITGVVLPVDAGATQK